MSKIVLTVGAVLILGSSWHYFLSGDKSSEQEPQAVQSKTEFSSFNSKFKFSAPLPDNWRVAHIPQIESIAVVDAAGETQVFIRYFEASQFLTLQTVDILKREQIKVGVRDAVRYEIKKKPGVPDFPYQPAWRNELHSVTDIRLSQSSPSLFYVFARNPNLPERDFGEFIDSLVFQ